MATRGQIAIRKKDGTIDSVYSHWDNYITGGNGELLLNSYNDEDEIKQLIYGGNISSLGNTIYKTTYYGRDMGRKGEGFDTFKDEKDWIENSNFDGVDYNYLYDVNDSDWYVSSAYHENNDGLKLDSFPLLIALEEKLAKGGKIINNKNMSEHEHFNRGGRQGYNDRLDESLAMRRGKKRQNFKDRRDESKGNERSRLRKAYSSVGTMDRFNSPYRLARGGNSHNDSMSMLRKYDVRSPYGTYSKGGRPKKAKGGKAERNIYLDMDIVEDVLSGSDTSAHSKLIKMLDRNNVKMEVLTWDGPAGGHPLVSLYGTRNNIKKALKANEGWGLDETDAKWELELGSYYAKGGDVHTGSRLNKAGDSNFTFSGDNKKGVYAGRDISMMAARGKSLKKRKSQRAQGGDVFTGRDVSMMAAKGKLVPSLHPTHKEVLQLMSLPEVEAQQYIIGQKDLVIGKLKDKMQDIHEFAELALQGDDFALEQIESISDHARFNQGGEAYTGSKLADAGNTDFSFTGKSGSNETYTGKDVTMMAAQGGKTGWNWTEKEVRKGANTLAEALTINDMIINGIQEGVTFKVHDFEYDKGKGASFELSKDGEKHMGGSYYVIADGTMVNAAATDPYGGGGDYGQLKDSKEKIMRDVLSFQIDSEYAKGGNVGDKIRVSKTPYMISFMDLYDKDLEIKDIKEVNFASGNKEFYIVNYDGKDYEIPEDMIQGYAKGGDVYTGKDVNMMAARGKSLKKVKKASKGGETGIGMF